jgi:hypothetical protein
MILILLVVFQIKHFVADYLLQGKYMLGKFNADWSFFKPLAAHAGVHSGFTFIITGALVGFWPGLALGLFDGVTHFVTDRIKAGPKYFGKYQKDQKEFWWALGFDQMVHHLVHYIIIAIVIGILY